MSANKLQTLLHKLSEAQALPDVEQAVENELLSYVTEDNRICPKPPEWDSMYQLLSDTKREFPPLILASWWESTDKDKHYRLKQQINFAKEHHLLLDVAEYLLALPDEHWVYIDE